jgi:hypothetical protein
MRKLVLQVCILAGSLAATASLTYAKDTMTRLAAVPPAAKASAKPITMAAWHRASKRNYQDA